MQAERHMSASKERKFCATGWFKKMIAVIKEEAGYLHKKVSYFHKIISKFKNR
jgi:hypothetical protein